MAALSGSVVSRALAGTTCTAHEATQAQAVKGIHDVIEEVAYRAFVTAVRELGITTNDISAEQAGAILFHVKKEAHRELFRSGGYMAERGKILTPEQIAGVIRKVGEIIHDRDTRLTDSRYRRLTTMVMGFDSHNAMVKGILLRSWFKNDSFSDDDRAHLEEIKGRVDFYPELGKILPFNFGEALRKEEAFWDRCFPGLREGSESANAFMHTQEVRHYFGEHGGTLLTKKETATDTACAASDGSGGGSSEGSFEVKITIPTGSITRTIPDLDVPLRSLLSEAEANAIFGPREIHNRVRCKSACIAPLLSDTSMTVGAFFKQYFPEHL
jgi:hypothetical protein